MKTIDIQAKEWVDRVNGNSYFSAQVTIDFGMGTERIVYVPFQYGYGDTYLYEAFDALTREDFIPKTWTTKRMKDYCDHYNIIFRYSKQDKCLKRDVIAFGSN